MQSKDKKQTLRSKRLAVEQWMRGTRVRMFLVALIALFGVLYIGQTSSVSTKGFEISDLQKQIRELEQQTRSIDVEIAQHRSMVSIQNRLSDKGFVPAGQPQYIDVVGSAVVRR